MDKQWDGDCQCQHAKGQILCQSYIDHVDRCDAKGEEDTIEHPKYLMSAHGITESLADAPVASVEHAGKEWQQKYISCQLHDTGSSADDSFDVCHCGWFVDGFVLLFLV